MRFAALLFGAGFGFVLSRARATDYDTITGMFRLRDFYLVGVMGVAIAVAAIGLAVLKRQRRSAVLGGPIEVHPKPAQPGLFAAGLVFGTGWAVTGACPGPVMTQLGELKLYALFTAAGILTGTWVFGARGARAPRPRRRPATDGDPPRVG
jgi:hypothetical protein